MDSDERDQETDCKPAARKGADAADNAPYNRSIQSGIESFDRSPYCVRCEEGSCVTGHAQKEVSIWIYLQNNN